MVKQNKRKLMVLHSGGLDVTVSTGLLLATEKYDEVVYVYLEYGCKAQDEERDMVIKRLHFDSEYHSDIEFEFASIDVGTIYNKIFDPFNIKFAGLSSLTDDEERTNEQGEKESESDSAYVPFRNSLFGIMMAMVSEAKWPGENIDICTGLNLSEAMTYRDNSEPFMRTMNELMFYGASKTIQNINYVAPLFNLNKTKIVELGYSLGLSLKESSFSCYEPVDGKECGKCGSCLLKHKAIDRVLKDKPELDLPETFNGQSWKQLVYDWKLEFPFELNLEQK